MDCFGECDGSAVVDDCGVCGGGGPPCGDEEDCNGVPGGDAWLDDCGVCGGDNSTCEGCDGIPDSLAWILNCPGCAENICVAETVESSATPGIGGDLGGVNFTDFEGCGGTQEACCQYFQDLGIGQAIGDLTGTGVINGDDLELLEECVTDQNLDCGEMYGAIADINQDGGYTQADIIELAAYLTDNGGEVPAGTFGWTGAAADVGSANLVPGCTGECGGPTEGEECFDVCGNSLSSQNQEGWVDLQEGIAWCGAPALNGLSGEVSSFNPETGQQYCCDCNGVPNGDTEWFWLGQGCFHCNVDNITEQELYDECMVCDSVCQDNGCWDPDLDLFQTDGVEPDDFTYLGCSCQDNYADKVDDCAVCVTYDQDPWQSDVRSKRCLLHMYKLQHIKYDVVSMPASDWLESVQAGGYHWSEEIHDGWLEEKITLNNNMVASNQIEPSPDSWNSPTASSLADAETTLSNSFDRRYVTDTREGKGITFTFKYDQWYNRKEATPEEYGGFEGFGKIKSFKLQNLKIEYDENRLRAQRDPDFTYTGPYWRELDLYLAGDWPHYSDIEATVLDESFGVSHDSHNSEFSIFIPSEVINVWGLPYSDNEWEGYEEHSEHSTFGRLGLLAAHHNGIDIQFRISFTMRYGDEEYDFWGALEGEEWVEGGPSPDEASHDYLEVTYDDGICDINNGQCTDIPAGDMNADGGWNVLDIVTLANCVLLENCDFIDPCGAGDMNGDGGFNVLDIVTLANCVLNENCADIDNTTNCNCQMWRLSTSPDCVESCADTEYYDLENDDPCLGCWGPDPTNPNCYSVSAQNCPDYFSAAGGTITGVCVPEGECSDG